MEVDTDNQPQAAQRIMSPEFLVKTEWGDEIQIEEVQNKDAVGQRSICDDFGIQQTNPQNEAQDQHIRVCQKQ